MSFKLTYATMFNPPEELHGRFEAAMTGVLAKLGAYHPLYIAGEERRTREALVQRNPARQAQQLGQFAAATAADVDAAMQAAHAAFPAWRQMPLSQRARLLRRVGQLIEERVYDIAAALTLEVGKNRMEALGRRRRRPTSSPPTATTSNTHRALIARCPTIRSPITCRATAASSSPTAPGW